MKLLLLLSLVAAAVLGVAWFLLKRRSADQLYPSVPWPYYAKKPLSRPAQVLFHLLIKALPAQIVLDQVQVRACSG